VLAGFGRQVGLNDDTAIRLGRAFGGGMGRGLVCGAVSGALMVLGLAGPDGGSGEAEARGQVVGQAAEFIRRFEARRGSIICNKLVGLDISTPAGLREAREKGLFKAICPGIVREAAQILNELLQARGPAGS